MSKVYGIADLHFGHENLAKHRGFASAKEQDELIISNWNSIIAKRDTVLVLRE